MPKAYSQDLRDRVIDAVEHGETGAKSPEKFAAGTIERSAVANTIEVPAASLVGGLFR